MRLTVSLGLIGLLLASTHVSSRAGPSYRSDPAYKSLLKLQHGVKSSVAVLEVHTKVRSFPPMSLTFRGHSYFQAPDKQTVVFDNVPGMLKGMVKDSPSIAPAAAWPSQYDVSVIASSGGQTIFHCEPRDGDATLASADVTVDVRTGEMTTLLFKNKNGSETTTQQTYQRIGGHDVIVSQTGQSHGRGYKADVETTFTDYRFNVSIPPDVFART